MQTRPFPEQVPGDRFATQIPLEVHPPHVWRRRRRQRPALSAVAMGSISINLTACFSAPGEPPAGALARWRATPPNWLPERYREIEDSYNSVTWNGVTSSGP